MNAMQVVTQVAFTGMRVVTQDFGHKSKLKFWL
jgi:succinate dehydrogenase hydrophobic anchor subunit